jgi:hypothetical protein
MKDETFSVLMPQSSALKNDMGFNGSTGEYKKRAGVFSLRAK